MTYDRELRVALEAADRAGQLILDHYEHFQVIPDAPADITTDTDRQSQEAILAHIQSAFPGHAFCAEETTAAFASAPRTGQQLWIIDPIDGTRGFARKNGEFSVMIGFVDDGQVAVGVVLEPALRRLTYAVRGGGCWRRDGSETAPTRCTVTTTAKLKDATVVQSHSRNPGQPSRQIKALNPVHVVETYSAGIKLAKVARGEVDLYLNTYDACHDWDICAGHILVDEAGGQVTNLAGETPQYGLPGALQQNGLLASNKLLHAAAVDALARSKE
jgi:3'(2'), 5'-bisphosphate nucleotidase